MRTLTVDRQVIERKVLAKVAHWTSLLAGGTLERRQFLREVLDGPIYFKLEGNAYRFSGPTDEAERFLTSWAVPPLWRPHGDPNRDWNTVPFAGEVVFRRVAA